MITRIALFVVFLTTCGVSAQSQIPLPGPGALGNLGIWFVRTPVQSLMDKAGASAGAYVDRVVKNSPAARIGLQTGDVIVELGGKPIANAEDIDNLFRLRRIKAGQTIEVNYIRKGALQTRSVTVSNPASIFPRMRVPFVAKRIVEKYWTENGTDRYQKLESKLYRESSGRIASESLHPEGTRMVRSVSIFDPVKMRRITINDFDETVSIVKHEKKLPADFVFPNQRPEFTLKWVWTQPSEYLGTKTIQGLTCEGWRIEGILEGVDFLGITSDKPLRFSGEQWMSDLTVYAILTITENPLQGRVIERLEDVREGEEPDPAIFEIPEDYELTEVELADILLQQDQNTLPRQ